MNTAKQNVQERQYLIPMEVTEDTIHDFGIAASDVVWARIGNRRVRAILVPVEQEVYYAYMRPLWREDKYRQRSLQREILCDWEDGWCDLASEDATPDAVVLERMQAEALYAAMDSLEERDYVILQMAAEGYSENIIAQTIGMSQKGVNKRKHKAFAQLRALLQGF